MIRARSISVSLANRIIVENFSIDIEPGKITAILGPNGSGKSTLISALAGDIPISHGEVTINDRSIDNYSVKELAMLRAVSAQHQRFSLAFTVSDVLTMATMRSGNSETIARAIEALDMDHLLTRKATSLSGGEQQRVCIAMALSQDTPYIYLDEPYAAQDLASSQRITSHFRHLATQGKSVVVVAHIDEANLEWCDQIVRLGPTQ